MIPSPPLGTDATAGRPPALGAAGAGPDQAAAERRFRFELAAHPGSPAQARRLTRARLTGWSVCEDTCDSAALIVSELVTNAIVHTASDVVVCELHDGEELVRIAVRDQGCAPGEPKPSPQRGEEEHGRGLLLVDALCHAWGAQEHGPGLLVWAELPRKADTPRDPSEPHNAVDWEPDASVAAADPHCDLGWGARPKPGGSGGSGEEDAPGTHDTDDEAEQRLLAAFGDPYEEMPGGVLHGDTRTSDPYEETHDGGPSEVTHREAHGASPDAPDAHGHDRAEKPAPEPRTAGVLPRVGRQAHRTAHSSTTDGDATARRPHPVGRSLGFPRLVRGREWGRA